MELYENNIYMADVACVAGSDLPWNKLKDKSILITGASGLIGSFLIDVIMMSNSIYKTNCKIYAVSRNSKKLKQRFSYCDNSLVEFIEADVNKPIIFKENSKIDYVIHLASNTHPVAYSTDPIGTITTNIIGTQNVFDFAVEHNSTRCLFASSVEVYGENRGDVEDFDENYCGYINCNTLRAGYPESKRCGEALCQAYISQKNLDIVIPRIPRTFGPTLLKSDTKALSQFIYKGVNGQDIILKSEGTQFFSYLYVADTVSGLLAVLLNGNNGETYNIVGDSSDIKLKELANMVAEISKTRVIFDIPDSVESKGYSVVTKAVMNGEKIKALGWKQQFSLFNGIEHTIDILK